MRSLGGDERHVRVVRQAATGTAAVALCFSLFVIVEMFETRLRMTEDRPVDHPFLVALREDLAREPGSDGIRQEIRGEEMILRERFLTSDRRLEQGAWMLLVGVATFALAAKLALVARRQVPSIVLRGVSYDPDRGLSVYGRVSVAIVGLALAGTAVAVPFLREEDAVVETARGVWPRFRGAGGLGVSPHEAVPLALDGREGQERNLRWKSVVPLPGISSPVVWNERIYLTGATENTREVYCFDAGGGALLWRRPVSAGPESSEIPENIWEETGYAAPTPVTDGEHVWALFANGDVVCLDPFGGEAWCVNLGLPMNMYGLAASPILLEEKLVIQFDQDWGDDGFQSFLIALEAATGEELWRVPREVESSWPTPIPIAGPRGVQILTCANPFVIAYDPSDGSEVWRVDCLEGDGGPSPVFGEGYVFAVNVGSPLTAIRLDGEGDVTKTHVAWEWHQGLPDVCTPLVDRGLLWLLSTDGQATCLEARTGELVWEEVFEASFYASPVLAGDRIYLIGRKGEVIVFGTGREYQELSRGHLGEACDTSPAFGEGRIYVRGRRHLFCFEEAGS